MPRTSPSSTYPVPYSPAWAPYKWVALLLCLVGWVHMRLHIKSVPQPASGPVTVFSEERAWQHDSRLARDIADRQVSMPGLAEATAYIVAELHALKAGAAHRQDVTVKVLKETFTGGAAMDFLATNFTNNYRDLDVVTLTITPKGTEGLKALLVAAHHDSAVCSQGASDDGAQSSVMLEVARVILSRPVLPATPVVFAWTGGEEPVSPAAHGWSTQSPTFKQLGAFINLEAMGGGGLPIVFQHTGAWVLRAWAQGCPLPRGSRVAQDVFDLQIIPADSDFRMFSARHYGSLPGVDVAFVMDSRAYHTYLDMPERLKPGILQEMGEGVLGGIQAVSAALAQRQRTQPPLTPQQELEDAQERAVFFDVMSYGMIMYSDKLAVRLHTLPVLVLLALPMLTYNAGQSPHTGAGKAASARLRAAYVQMLWGAVRAFVNIILALALPVGLGVARTLLFDKPMVWFAHHWVGHLQFMPISAAGALLPWVGLQHAARKAAPVLSEGAFMASQIQGSGFVASLIGAGLTAAGLTGNALIFSTCGALAVVVSLLVAAPRLTLVRMIALAAASVVPAILGGCAVAVFVRVMMERMALSGTVHAVLGDVVVGVLSGTGVLAVTCAVYLPLMGYGFSKRGASLAVLALTLTSLGAAGYSALYTAPYTPESPKRVVLNHLHQTVMVRGAGEAGGAAPAPPGGVAMGVVGEAVSMAGTDSTFMTKVINMSAFTEVAPVGREFTPLYPLDHMMHGPTVAVPRDPSLPLIDRQQRYLWRGGSPAPGLAEQEYPEPLVTHLPFVQLVRVEDVPAQRYGGEDRPTAGVKRLHLRLFTERPCWGILNITGIGLVGWSFTDTLAHSSACKSCGAARKVVARLTTQSPDPYWPFWIDMAPGMPGGGTPQGGIATPTNSLAATTVLQRAAAAAADTGDETDAPEAGTPSDAAQRASELEPGADLGIQLPLGLRIELSISYLQRTAVLRRVLAMLPPYMAETWLATVYQSYWEL